MNLDERERKAYRICPHPSPIFYKTLRAEAEEDENFFASYKMCSVEEHLLLLYLGIVVNDGKIIPGTRDHALRERLLKNVGLDTGTEGEDDLLRQMKVCGYE